MNNERERLRVHDERLMIYERDQGICQACREPVPISDFEVAHRIAKTQYNIKRWGKDIVDNPLNKATTHRGRCNSAMNIGFKPEECRKLIARINKQDELGV